MNIPSAISAGGWRGKYLGGADGDQDLAKAMSAALALALMLV